MPWKIVAWNIQGQYDLSQILDRCRSNGWDVLIVLEPSVAIGAAVDWWGLFPVAGQIKQENTTSLKLRSASPVYTPTYFQVFKVNVGDQNIVIVLNDRIDMVHLPEPHEVLMNWRQAVSFTVRTSERQYRIFTAHSPFDKNSSIASNYQRALISLANANGADLIIGDLNTFGNSIGTKRSVGDLELLSKGMNTSKGNQPLDKAIARKKLVLEDVKAEALDFKNIKVPAESFFPDLKLSQKRVVSKELKVQEEEPRARRDSTKEKTWSSLMGQKKIPDHKPLLVKIPGLKPTPSGSKSSKKYREKEDLREQRNQALLDSLDDSYEEAEKSRGMSLKMPKSNDDESDVVLSPGPRRIRYDFNAPGWEFDSSNPHHVPNNVRQHALSGLFLQNHRVTVNGRPFYVRLLYAQATNDNFTGVRVALIPRLQGG